MSVSVFRPAPTTDGGPPVPLVESHAVLQNPTAFPTVWNGIHRYMMPSTFAVWSDSKKDFQIVEVDRNEWPLLKFNYVASNRTNPFYFAEDPMFDRQSRTVTVYRPRARIHTHVDVAVWYTGGWLCKRNGQQLRPVIPFLGVSDHRILTWVGNPGIRVSQDFLDWQTFQTSFHTTPIIRNRLLSSALQATTTEESAKPAAPEPIPLPAFVARALLRDAIASEQVCPITMDPLTEGAATVTTCFHVFDREAIAVWRTRTAACPVCKQVCDITNV